MKNKEQYPATVNAKPATHSECANTISRDKLTNSRNGHTNNPICSRDACCRHINTFIDVKKWRSSWKLGNVLLLLFINIGGNRLNDLLVPIVLCYVGVTWPTSFWMWHVVNRSQ